MTTLSPYQSRSVYAPVNDSDLLHGGPVGRERADFRLRVWNAQHPQAGDGAARAAFIPPEVAAARDAQPAPSPSIVDGGAR